jgi:hypothetical protein
MPSGGKGGSKSQVSGYKYTMAVQMGVGRGPVNELTDIRIGDLSAWSGSLMVSDFQQINQPNLFGGDQKEGGIVGTFKLMMGEADQVVDSIITGAIEGGFPVPGWRGVTSLFYYGQIGSNNPYPKPWKLRVNRQTAGWDGEVWRPDLAVIPMQTAPVTLITFNTQPHSGDGIAIGDEQVDFFTYLTGASHNVAIGSTAEETASRFAAVCNGHSDELYGVDATVSGLVVSLMFGDPVVVREIRGNFTSISQQGGGVKAMNPAHILYECATNNIWGRGMPRSFIDHASFTAVAQTLISEGFGICIRWNRQEDIDRFVQIIVNTIGGVVYIDRQTGLLKLRLLRADYAPEALPIFTFENGMLEIIEDESSSSDTTYNEIIVNYIDPISGRKGQVRVQNIASFQSLGTMISTSVDYLGVPTPALAMRLAQRDLQANSADVRRMRIKFDRVGFSFAPGDVIRISAPSRGIGNLILRIGEIEEGPLEDNTITVVAVQDVFSLPATSFVTPQRSFWIPPDRSARVISERLVGEMTYFDLSENLPPAELGAVTADTGVVKIFAERPGGAAMDYVVSSKTTSEVGFVERNIAGFDAGAELVGDIGLRDTVFSFTSGSSMELVTAAIGTPIVLVSRADPTIQEYCRLDDIDLLTGELTVARGCIDTVLHEFKKGDKIWFQSHAPTTDFRDYSTSEIVQVKLLTRTSSEQLDAALADTDEVDIGGRQGRPYPPGNLRVNGDPYELNVVSTAGDRELTWSHRDRITQANFLLEHSAGSTGPESGITYTIRVYDGADPEPTTVLRVVSLIAGTSWTYTNGMDIVDGQLPSYWFTLESVRGTFHSWQRYEFRLYRVGAFDDDFDYNFDGGPP